MTLSTKLSDTAANAAANALITLFNNGYLKIYSGSQPTNANTAISGQALLCTLRFNATFSPSASGGVLTANSITAGNAIATATAAWFRAYQSDNVTVICDGSVGTATSNLILSTTSLTIGSAVSCTSFTYTLQEATSGI